MVATDSATRRGSSVSSGAGLPVAIWQKSHRLVHWSPPMRKVASRSSQHSKMLGQPASSQTVCKPSRLTRCPGLAVVTADEEGRLAVLPALEDVGAARLLADRVQALPFDQAPQFCVGGPGAQPRLDPRGLPLDGGLAVTGFQAEQPASLRCEYHPTSLRRAPSPETRVPSTSPKSLVVKFFAPPGGRNFTNNTYPQVRDQVGCCGRHVGHWREQRGATPAGGVTNDVTWRGFVGEHGRMLMQFEPPSGTRDFLAADVEARERAFAAIRSVFARYGFEPLQTPAFERLDVLLGKYGEEGDKLIFKILRRGEHEASGEADLALRYDMTVPLARVAAAYGSQLPTPYKRYAMGPVWRADRPGRGRFREFVQCDLDTLGTTSVLADAEVICAVHDTLAELGVPDFRFLLNSRHVLAGLLEAFGVPAELGSGVLITLDKLDKLSAADVAAELTERGLAPGAAQDLVSAMTAPDADER